MYPPLRGSLQSFLGLDTKKPAGFGFDADDESMSIFSGSTMVLRKPVKMNKHDDNRECSMI